MEFMLETICDIKNNKKRTKEETVQHTRINKWLQKVLLVIVNCLLTVFQLFPFVADALLEPITPPHGLKRPHQSIGTLWGGAPPLWEVTLLTCT